MAETPSARRRKGRNAYDPQCDPMELQPYNPESWSYEYNLKDWLDGWEEGREIYEQQQESGEKESCSNCKDRDKTIFENPCIACRLRYSGGDLPIKWRPRGE